MRKNFTPLGIVTVVAAILIVGAGVWYLVLPKNSPQIACTQEAKLCPDGSYVGRTGPHCEFSACPEAPASSTPPIVDTSSWKTYTSNEFGFSFQYPSTWQKSNDVLSVVNPHIFFGNPLNGITTYGFKVFVLDNPRNLSAADFVKEMLADEAMQDASASAQGPAPQVTQQFSKQYAVTVGGYPGYELYGVFAYDQHDEQIYIQQNKQMLEFVFPVADPNPNIANAAANNVTAHQIVSTVKIDLNIWKFCGGIAAFPCASGYSCKFDGTYPDAGGHCVKN